MKEATIKDPMTGRLTTMRNVVDGPCAVFKTTTQPEMDAETKSRFIITSIDESPEQTKAILEAQRHNHTLDGIRRKKQREQVVQRHHAFQRLLKPVAVVNPYEPLLTYAENRLLVRRDNPKYLHLILAVTFLYQLQRPVKHDADAGDCPDSVDSAQLPTNSPTGPLTVDEQIFFFLASTSFIYTNKPARQQHAQNHRAR